MLSLLCSIFYYKCDERMHIYHLQKLSGTEIEQYFLFVVYNLNLKYHNLIKAA